MADNASVVETTNQTTNQTKTMTHSQSIDANESSRRRPSVRHGANDCLAQQALHKVATAHRRLHFVVTITATTIVVAGRRRCCRHRLVRTVPGWLVFVFYC